jgi:hypothetical protein
MGGNVAKLIYSALTSLDGFVADESGNFDWAAPDAEVHTFDNDLARPIGTQPCRAGRPPGATRAARRAPIRQRRRVPALPNDRLTTAWRHLCRCNR